MSDYLSTTERETEEMLQKIGVKTIDELFEDIPDDLKLKKLNLPEGKSQQETMEIMTALSKKNKVYDVILRGAGSYDHYIPSMVKNLSSRSEFITAYTPYQAEMSQGILQAIFEYQSMICNLTGLEISNASVYNGANAAAEAMLMCAERNRKTLITFDNIRPDTLKVLNTYAKRRGITVQVLHAKDGVCDMSALKAELNDTTAAVYIEQPNYFGLIEDATEIGVLAHEAKAKFIMGCNPTALAVLKSPAECGADIAVGDAQPLGLPMAFGGPYVGFMACTSKEMRKMPGRIVGETTDHDGNRAYVLTLQAREQHIRREKAYSNICSNQAYCALIVSMYMSAMGANGMAEVAEACVSYAHYLADALKSVGFEIKYKGEFFHEFVTVSEIPADKILKALDKAGILGGLKLSKNEILWCATEKLSKADIDKAVEVIRRVK